MKKNNYTPDQIQFMENTLRDLSNIENSLRSKGLQAEAECLCGYIDFLNMRKKAITTNDKG